MEITLDGQPMFIEVSDFFILLIPGMLFILYLFFVVPKVYVIPQKYIENKYRVKLVFRWRYFYVEGKVSALQKFLIGLYYLILIFLITFSPVLLLGLLTFSLQDYIHLMPLS